MATRRLPIPTLRDSFSDEETKPWRPDESAIVRKPAALASRYTPLGVIGSGGMGTVYLARAAGSAGFSRLVAMKRLHAHLSAEKEFIAMLVDEARLTSGLRHVNVMSTLDLVADDGGFSMVLDYVEGAALNVLLREAGKHDEEVPREIALALIAGVLRGLDAVHDARGTEGQPLGIVHRDISPANVLVGVDGVPRIIDFGVAKALGRVSMTKPGELRGKFAYMAPEQLRSRPVTRQADVYAVGVVLWELLTGARLFQCQDERATCAKVIRGDVPLPTKIDPSIPAELEAIVMKALSPELSDRWLSAREMLDALSTFDRASDDEVGRWVRALAAEELAKRAELVQKREPEAFRSLEDLVAEVKRSGSRPSEIVAARPASSPTLQRPITPPAIQVTAPLATLPPLTPVVAPAKPDAISVHFGLIYMIAVAIFVVTAGLTLGAIHRRMVAPTPNVSSQVAPSR